MKQSKQSQVLYRGDEEVSLRSFFEGDIQRHVIVCTRLHSEITARILELLRSEFFKPKGVCTMGKKKGGKKGGCK